MSIDNQPSVGMSGGPSIFTRVAELIHTVAWFFLDWRCSRDWKYLAGGLPAIALGGGGVLVVLIGLGTSKSSLVASYNQAASDSLAQKDYPAAQVYYRRMAMLDGASSESIFGLALTAVGQKDRERARTLMRRIAPENASGYVPAHIWLAKDALGRGSPLSPAESSIVEQDLLKSLAGGSQISDVHALLGFLYWSRGDTKQAILHTEEAAKDRPELMASLAVMYAKQKDDAASKNAALKARDYFARKTDAEPNMIDYRLQWGLTELLLQDYEKAVTVLQPGLTSSDPSRFRNALAGAYLAWYEATPAGSTDGLSKRIELLKSALDYGPNDPQVLNALAHLSTGNGSDAAQARQALENLLAKGTAAPIVHAILGTMALQNGEVAKARIHLDLAYQGDPRIASVLNNLAWIMATQEKPDLEHALPLAENARKLSNDPEMSATLGTILFRLGRNRDAIKELEIAAAAFPKRARIHEELGECYEKLGDPELASLHRHLAQECKSPPDKHAQPKGYGPE